MVYLLIFITLHFEQVGYAFVYAHKIRHRYAQEVDILFNFIYSLVSVHVAKSHERFATHFAFVLLDLFDSDVKILTVAVSNCRNIFQIHMVHYNDKYTPEEATTEKDGITVLAILNRVSGFVFPSKFITHSFLLQQVSHRASACFDT